VLSVAVVSLSTPSQRSLPCPVSGSAEYVLGGPLWAAHLFPAAEQIAAVLLSICAAYAVLPLEFKPAHNMADLLVQHLVALEQEAHEKGSIQHLLADHIGKVYKVAMSVGSTAA
jgi:hypothetical protein